MARLLRWQPEKMKLLHGDVLSFARHYKGEPFHALLCDSPYELGFMGRDWDKSGISSQPETWEALGNLLYPGAFGMTFGGSRTAHRMAVAIEDAGFIIHPMIGWVYGSGFPKATRIDTQIDREAGYDVQKGKAINTAGKGNRKDLHDNIPDLSLRSDYGYVHETHTDLAKQWEGHRYGLQALKPALEPIIVFQKPYPKDVKPVDSITKTGAGALNINGGRIGGSWKWGTQTDIRGGGYGSKRPSDGDVFDKNVESHPKGRWPPNFVLTHSPDCEQIGYQNDSYQINRFTDGAKPFGDGAGHEFESEEMAGSTPVWECVDGCPVKELDRQSGVSKSSGGRIGKKDNSMVQIVPAGEYQAGNPGFGDIGGASRFFHQSHYAPFFYQAKASVSEREVGLRGHVPCGYDKCRGIDTLTHIDENGKIRECRRCIHPTIKPIELIRHLATLLLPPEAYAPRRLLVPFCGTGSEIIGAFQAGWECVIGIELEKEYVNIGRARLKYWLEQGVQLPLLQESKP